MARKRRKGLEGPDELYVASIDAAGVGWGRAQTAWCSRGILPRSGGSMCGSAELSRIGKATVTGKARVLVFVCAYRGRIPRLHRAEGCAVEGSEPSFGSARRQASAESMDAVISPVRGLRSLSVLWPSSGGLASALGAVPPNLGAADP